MQLDDVTIRNQIERLLNSRALKNSENHRRLLSYLAEKSLAGEAQDIKEYTVALEVLGKPPSYDPRHDSTARIQAARLRQKLVQYYMTEGTTDPVIVNMPKGGFQLRFEMGRQNGDSAPERPSSRRFAPGIIPLAAVAVLLALWAGYATLALSRARKQVQAAATTWAPELEQLWAPFLQSSRPVRLCLGTPLFVYFNQLGFFRYPWANQWEELQDSAGFASLQKGVGSAEGMPWYGFAATGDVDAAFLVGKLLAARRPEIVLTRSHTLSWQQAWENELIFVGPPKFNDQLDQLTSATEIVLEPRGIRIRKPRPGEPAFLEDKYQTGKQFDGETYALISMVPGLSGVGRVLMLGGNASAATYAAAQWLTQPAFAKQLVHRLRLPSGQLPQSYQVVLKVQFRDGIPLESSYLLHRSQR